MNIQKIIVDEKPSKCLDCELSKYGGHDQLRCVISKDIVFEYGVHDSCLLEEEFRFKEVEK